MSSEARFGQVVRQRRQELDLTHDQVAAAGGPSTTTMTKIEAKGGPASVRTDTLRRLDDVLRWAPGSARRTWEGGEPSTLDQPPAGVDQLSDDELLAELARRLGAAREEVTGNDAEHPAAKTPAPAKGRVTVAASHKRQSPEEKVKGSQSESSPSQEPVGPPT